MSNNKLSVEDVLNRIKDLNNARELVSKKTNEIEVHTKDLNAIETIKGIESDDYKVKREVLDLTKKELEDAEKEVERLSFKRSELKTVYDETAKKFEQELRNEQEREFHVEVGPRPNPENPEDIDEDGNLRPLTKEEQNAGRKAYRKLVDYLYNNVNWTAKTAPGLMVLVRNMDENKFWTRDNEFDNVIKLRSSNVLVLWRSVLEDMTGTGYHSARAFLECWANCGKSISETVREIQKLHENVRIMGTQLNTIEEEYFRSENDITEETKITTQEEVAPEV